MTGTYQDFRLSIQRLRHVSSSFTVLLLLTRFSHGQQEEFPYVQQKNLIIAEVHGVAVTMDVFRPPGNKNGLAIIDVVSGAWHSDRGKIRDHKLAQIYNIFCRRGYVVFAIRPGSVSRFSAADMISHIEAGIRKIRSEASEYSIDADRIGITGASAGGHLASLVALRPENKIAAAGVFFPPTDFLEFGSTRIDPKKNDRFGRYLRALTFRGEIDQKSAAEIEREIIKICPARQVTGKAPPFLLIHGDADDVVPLQQSEKFLAALQAENVDAKLIVKKGGGHPWLTIPIEVAKLADWFDKQLSAIANLSSESDSN